MVIMKKYKIIAIFYLGTLITLLSLTPIVISDTTIGESTFPADEGDFYKWTCTYCDPLYTPSIGAGSWVNKTIEKIYQGSYMAISYALIVNVTSGNYFKGTNTHSSHNDPTHVVYNKSLPYFEGTLWIIPIPLNLTLISEFYELIEGYPCTVDGNTLIIDWGLGVLEKRNYNSNGFTTLRSVEINDTTITIYSLEGATGPIIHFGSYYIGFSIIGVAIMTLIVKKRLKKIK